MRHVFVLLLTTLAAAQQATAPAAAPSSFGTVQAPPATYRFPLNQTLSYTSDWRLFTAGTATIRVEAAGREHRILTSADATGAVRDTLGRTRPVTAIPYYAWSHRGPGEMAVWLRRVE